MGNTFVGMLVLDAARGKRGKTFRKARIASFAEALKEKLAQMVHDLGGGTLFDEPAVIKQYCIPQITLGSCLEILPTLENQNIDVVLTSPPYCNRYDYTRTYALELVFLGNAHTDITNLRQRMLSCTVENKTKRAEIEALYYRMERSGDFQRVEEVFNAQSEFQCILEELEKLKEKLPNKQVIQLCVIIFMKCALRYLRWLVYSRLVGQLLWSMIMYNMEVWRLLWRL